MVIFIILKIIGIVLACVAGFLVFAIVTPLVYKAEAGYHEKFDAEAQASWLLGIVRIYASYVEKPRVLVKVLFFTVFDSDKPRKKKKKRKKKRGRKNKKKQALINKKKAAMRRKEQTQKEDVELFDIREDGSEEDEKSWLEIICDKIASILSSIAEWMRKANEKIKVFSVWLDEDHRRLITFLWTNGLKIFKKVKPREFSLNARGGTGDPFWTGRITGWTSIAIGMIGLPGVRFEPDFEEKVLDLDVSAKGHFFVLPVALIALKIYRNKDFKKYILKKG